MIDDLTRELMDSDAVPAGCKVCGARKYGICKALKASELLQFSNSTRRRKYTRGQTIVFEDDEIVEFANIVTGSVKLVKLMSDGRQQIVGLQFAPEFIGKPFSDREPVSVEAATDVEVCVFPRADFEKMLAQQPDFERELLRLTLKQLDEARKWMVTLGQKTAQEKLASFLMLMAKNKGLPVGDDPNKVEFVLPLKRSEIAEFLGLTIETVSRQLTILRQKNLIGMDNTHDITVHDLAALQTLSDGG